MPGGNPKRSTKAVRAAVIALATELGDAELVAEVTLAADDAGQYLRTFRARMADADADDRDDVPWLALIAGLDERGTVVEIGEKLAPRAVLERVEALAGAAGRTALAPLHDDGELDLRGTHEVLALCSVELAKAKRSLLWLDKATESYPVVVVSARAAANVVALARRAGGRVVRFEAKDLARWEKARRTAQARA